MEEQAQVAQIKADELLRWPNYADGSIANVPATVASLLGVSLDGLPPLRADLWQSLRARRVVLLIIDGVGRNLLSRVFAEGEGLLGKTAVSHTITSIFPSTTVAALSSLWTGSAPAQHSMMGLRLFFPEYATAGQMISFTPVFAKYPDALVSAGLEPEHFLQVPGVAQQLANHGIPTYSFKERNIVDSALSKMHGRGVRHDQGIVTFADMMVQMRQLLETKVAQPLYAVGYWAAIDTLSHVYGWSSPQVAAELRSLLAQIEQVLMAPLSAAARQDTALLIVADHGQVECPPSQYVVLDEHPRLQEMLFMRPVGEPRVAYLYAKHGRQTAVCDYINQELVHALIALPGDVALQSGLLGPPPHTAVAAERVGDVVVISREGYILLTKAESKKASNLYGRHGSLTRAEMEVPWLGFQLG